MASGGSDHLPTLVTYKEPPSTEATHSNKLNIKKIDWKKYKELCKTSINTEILGNNASYDIISDIIIQTASRCALMIRQRKPRRTVPYWNEKCKAAVMRKRKAKQRMQTTFHLDDCIEFRKVKAETQRIIREEQKSYWREYCSTLNEQSNLTSVWRASKKMIGASKKRTIPTIVDDQQRHYTIEDKVNALAKCLAKNSSNANFPPKFMEKKEEAEETRKLSEMRMKDNNPVINEDFVFHEMEICIRQCKKNKSPGQDKIHYEMIQNLPKYSKKTILQLYNQTWANGQLPENWKHAIILPFLKENKEASDPNSYRPIALTSTLCKLMERLITNRLTWFLETNNLLNKDQTGFRKNRTTADQIMRITNDITSSMNKNEYCMDIFIDLKKAYDMLWTNGILVKMEHMIITGRMYRWVKDFLNNRTFQVGDKLSTTQPHQLENGTPQGSVISPILFLIAINDFPEMENGVKKSIYADDSAIWKTGRSLETITKQMQAAVKKIENWCDQWGFNMSTDKTVGVVFCQHWKPSSTIIKLGNSDLNFVDHTKFLGLVLDIRMTWSRHIKHVVKKCQPVINLMRKITDQRWGADKTTLMLIYRAFIRS